MGHAVIQTNPCHLQLPWSCPHPVCRDLGETFKWAFLGTSNTDTAIFVDAAHNIVKELDADMPYFLTGETDILALSFCTQDRPWSALWEGCRQAGVRLEMERASMRPCCTMTVFDYGQPHVRGGLQTTGPFSDHADNMWFGDAVFSAAYHPHTSAPSCVPCNYSRDTSELAVVRPAGCPCRPEQLCQADKDQQIFPNASQYCGIPRYLYLRISSHRHRFAKSIFKSAPARVESIILDSRSPGNYMWTALA